MTIIGFTESAKLDHDMSELAYMPGFVRDRSRMGNIIYPPAKHLYSAFCYMGENMSISRLKVIRTQVADIRRIV